MKNKWIKQIAFPLLAALIWGTAFVFQSEAAVHIGPFTFNTMRGMLAFLSLGLILLGRDLWNKRKGNKQEESVPAEKRNIKALLIGGFLCGTVLAVAANLQQLGLGSTSPGKAAFITALYVVLVPVFSLFFGKKARVLVWIGVALATVGLYFLCITGTMTIETSDFFVFLCAFCFAAHIIVIDRVSPHVNGVELSCLQFLVMAVESAVCMLIVESPTWEAMLACLWPLFHVGVFSSSVAYTLQIAGQKRVPSAAASLLMSLESVFAVIASWIVLGDALEVQQIIGCVLIFAAIVLSQIPLNFKKKRRVMDEN
jgi:drug/metabolite transporter (DMT)-like permease